MSNKDQTLRKLLQSFLLQFLGLDETMRADYQKLKFADSMQTFQNLLTSRRVPVN